VAILALGTRNKKKGVELVELLAPLGIELVTLADIPEAMEVEETGQTFAENAALKAVEQARHLQRWVLGEDSGLAVDAIKGAPGVYSARYSGDNATDEANNRKLLDVLRDVPLEKRTAHYVCHATLSDPLGNIRAESEGQCHGRMLFEETGTEGFGYDPLFEIVEYHRTFGRLGLAVKGIISHRARALRLLIPQLARLIELGAWQ
jgi:XTP/dITP diphosphohydrolase